MKTYPSFAAVEQYAQTVQELWDALVGNKMISVLEPPKSDFAEQFKQKLAQKMQAPSTPPPAAQAPSQPAGVFPVEGFPMAYVTQDGTLHLVLDPTTHQTLYQGHPEGFGPFRVTGTGKSLIAHHATIPAFDGRGKLACFISATQGQCAITGLPIRPWEPRFALVGLGTWAHHSALPMIPAYFDRLRGVATAPQTPAQTAPPAASTPPASGTVSLPRSQGRKPRK